MNTSSARDCFPTTHWSVISNAGNSQSPRVDSALNELCRYYWPPLYVYACHRGTARADAQDWVQSFFISHFLKTNYLQALDSQKGPSGPTCSHVSNIIHLMKRSGLVAKNAAAARMIFRLTGRLPIKHFNLNWWPRRRRSASMTGLGPSRLLERVLAQLGEEMQAEGNGSCLRN